MIFGFGKQDYVITKSLYNQQKEAHALFKLKEHFSPNDEAKIYATFKTPDSFLVDAPLSEKDKERSRLLQQKLGITADQADELVVAKNRNCILLITNRQLWLTNSAKKIGVKTKVF
jgi:malate/lactate dehydrogenase